MQEGLSDFTVKQVIRPSGERSYIQKKEASLPPKTEGHQEESEQALPNFPQFTAFDSYPLSYHISPHLFTLHQAYVEMVRSSSPSECSHVRKNI